VTKVILHAWEENAQVYNCLDALLESNDHDDNEPMLCELREAYREAEYLPGERVYLADGIQSITVFTKLEGE